MAKRVGKKVRIADIAEKLGLSSTTVSFVLNERRDKGISEETVKLVLETAATLGYSPKVKSSMAGWTRAAFLTSDIANFNFHTSFFAGVYHYLQRKGPDSKVELSLLEFAPALDKAEAFSAYQRVVDSGAEVFLSNDRRIIDFMRGKGFKTILAQGGVVSDVICVHCDDYAAGEVAANHAFEMGHRRAGMIFPSLESARFNGFVERFRKLGGECPPEFIWTIPLDHAMLEREVAAKLADSNNIPSLFYCFADNVVFPVIRAFAAKGMSVPEDVSLIGTDNLYWGAYSYPAFTTVDLNEALFADKLIEAICHAAAGDATYQLAVPVKLIKRETVKMV